MVMPACRPLEALCQNLGAPRGLLPLCAPSALAGGGGMMMHMGGGFAGAAAGGGPYCEGRTSMYMGGFTMGFEGQ